MRVFLPAFAVTLVFTSGVAFGQATSPAARSTTTIRSFLIAADSNNFEAMLPLIAGTVAVDGSQQISAKDFLNKIAACYLRRVYKNDRTGELLAAWMCAEGENKSGVLIAQVAEAQSGVTLTVELEQHNARPAPARVGSALASERN